MSQSIHAGRQFTVSEVTGAQSLGYPRYILSDRRSGDELDMSWSDLVSMVADLNTYIGGIVDDPARDVAGPPRRGVDQPSAAEIARERWRT